MKISQLKEYQDDKQTKNRFNKFLTYFKNNSLLEFEDYYLHIRKEDNTEGLRWFHRNKYKVELVINASCYSNNRTHQNIASFVLFSSYEDAILHLILTEHKAIIIIQDEQKQKLNQVNINL